MLTTIILIALSSLLLWGVSYGCVYLAFGTEGIAIKKEQGKKVFGWILLMWALLRLYLSSVSMVFKEPFPPLFTIAVVCSFPVIYGIFVLFARRWANKAIAEKQEESARRNKQKKENEAKEKLAQQEILIDQYQGEIENKKKEI